ncbi:MAG: DUF362 domain-containing protein [Deltaproteobacteria bacterium]|nr:DUF362 domain-containing protein [Deltaproteobacteria bacterium]
MTSPSRDTTVGVYRCSDYDYDRVKACVDRIGTELLGGWGTFIPDGASVLIKPNFLKPATAAQCVSPHPVVVKAIAAACREAGAGKIIIGDSPGFSTAQKVAAKCGILDIANELGIEVVNFTESTAITAPPEFFHRQFSIAREAAEADIIINLPKFKTHAMMTMTLAVKNLYGLFVGKQKGRWHFQCGRDYHHFARLLVELAYSVKPAVSILDAVIGMEGNGPGSGSPRQLGFLAASRDMLSLDRVALDIAGVDPEQVPIFDAGRACGLDSALDSIPLIGDPVEPLKINDLKQAAHMDVQGPPYMRPLSWLIKRFVTVKPMVDAKACKGCRICLEACPAESIIQKQNTGPVSIDHNTCIRCFCCQELCPEGAIMAKEALGVKMMKALGLE